MEVVSCQFAFGSTCPFLGGFDLVSTSKRAFVDLATHRVFFAGFRFLPAGPLAKAHRAACFEGHGIPLL